MDRAREIRSVIKDIAGGGGAVFVMGEAVSVESDTCTVKIADRLTVGDVRLNASADGNKSNILAKPVVGSMVMMADLSGGELRDLVVIAFSEIDTLTVRFSGDVVVEGKDDIEADITDGKVCIKKGAVSFKAELDNLLDALSGAVIATPAGTGAFAADTVAKITQVKTKMNDILC